MTISLASAGLAMHGMAKNLAVGSRIELTGRIQSREYVKKLDEEQQETRVAYEVSASRIYMIEEGE